MNNPRRDAIRPDVFWPALSRKSAELHGLVQNRNLEQAYNQVQQLLDEACYPYIVEIAREGAQSILVFTPEGNHQVAKIVDWFTGFAPPLEGWRLYSRRQRGPIRDAFRFVAQIYQVDITDARFLLVNCSDGIVVQMYTSAADRVDPEQRQLLMSFFLQHVVGEDWVMRFITAMQFERLPRDTTDLLLPDEFVAAFAVSVHRRERLTESMRATEDNPDSDQ